MRRRLHPALSAVALGAAALAIATSASALEGRIVSVQDGDTLVVLDRNQARHRVRIAGIDAPEKNQPFGDAARAHLSRLTADRSVELRCHKRDRYGREVCNVYVGKQDVGLEQVRQGYAWWYRDYAREQRPQERADYAAAENNAKESHRGLWRDAQPTPPWSWRKRHAAQAGRSAGS
jgi:endonuclease YncB( thermonuclease family)